MTAGADPRNEPLSQEEQALAQRLVQWKTGEPDTALDQKILAQARSAVATPTARPDRRNSRRPWLVGLASAATFVFAVGLIWRVAEQPSESLPGMAREQLPATADEAPAESAARGVLANAESFEPVAPVQMAPPPMPERPTRLERSEVLGGAANTAQPAREATDQRAMRSDRDHPAIPAREGVPSPAEPPAPSAPPAPAHQRSSPAPADTAADAQAASKVAVAPVPPPAPPPPPPAPPAPPAPVSAPIPTSPPVATAPPAIARSRTSSSRQSERQAAEDGYSAEGAPVPAPPGSSAPARAFPREEVQQRPQQSSPAPAADVAAQTDSADFRRAVQRIRRLSAQDHAERALGAIDRLRQRHPDRELPEDLQRFVANEADQGR